MSSATRTFIYKLLRKKRIKLNGKRAEGGELLKAGDVIEFHLSQETMESSRKNNDSINPIHNTAHGDTLRNLRRDEEDIAPSKGSHPHSYDSGLPPIVYEDENLLIINKPAGLASHGGMKSTTPHLLARVLIYLGQKGDYSPYATFTPALCNRLDVNTSGLVVCGKNYQAIRAINALFATPSAIEKQYLAIVEGELTGSATLEGHYHKDTNTNIARITQGSNLPQVITQYTSISASTKYSLISINPITGRTHQIRAHMAAIGHPLAGDKKYGGKPMYSMKGQLLHCNMLKLTMPVLDYPASTTWTAKPPQEFIKVAEKMGISWYI